MFNTPQIYTASAPGTAPQLQNDYNQKNVFEADGKIGRAQFGQLGKAVAADACGEEASCSCHVLVSLDRSISSL